MPPPTPSTMVRPAKSLMARHPTAARGRPGRRLSSSALVDAPPPASASGCDGVAPPPLAQPRPSALRFFAVVLALFVLPGALAQAASPLLGLTWSELAAIL